MRGQHSAGQLAALGPAVAVHFRASASPAGVMREKAGARQLRRGWPGRRRRAPGTGAGACRAGSRTARGRRTAPRRNAIPASSHSSRIAASSVLSPGSCMPFGMSHLAVWVTWHSSSWPAGLTIRVPQETGSAPFICVAPATARQGAFERFDADRLGQVLVEAGVLGARHVAARAPAGQRDQHHLLHAGAWRGSRAPLHGRSCRAGRCRGRPGRAGIAWPARSPAWPSRAMRGWWPEHRQQRRQALGGVGVVVHHQHPQAGPAAGRRRRARPGAGAAPAPRRPAAGAA